MVIWIIFVLIVGALVAAAFISGCRRPKPDPEEQTFYLDAERER